MLKVGLIGAGGAGQKRAAAVAAHEGCELVAVCDRVTSLAEQVAAAGARYQRVGVRVEHTPQGVYRNYCADYEPLSQVDAGCPNAALDGKRHAQNLANRGPGARAGAGGACPPDCRELRRGGLRGGERRPECGG